MQHEQGRGHRGTRDKSFAASRTERTHKSPGDDGSNDRRRWRQRNTWKKLDLSPFCGEEPFTWLQKAEHFFSMQDMEEEDWVSTAMMAMEG